MFTFKTLFNEQLGKFKKPQTRDIVGSGVQQPPAYPPEEMSRRENLISAYKGKRREDYPESMNFVLTDTFRQLLLNCWYALPKENAPSFIIYGDPGIGKSRIIKDTGKQMAELENKYFPSHEPDGTTTKRTFIEWNKASVSEKDEIMKHPERYYVFLDIRAAYFTTASLEGLPVVYSKYKGAENMGAKEFFEVIPQRFIEMLSDKRVAGILFLDEINQASTEVKNIFLQVILDREFKDRVISNRVLIVAASNIGRAFQGQDFNPALSARFQGAVLIADPEEWFKYAEKAGIDDHIIQFVRSDPDSFFYKFPASGREGKNVQFPNPRSLVMFNAKFQSLLERYENVKNSGDAEELAKFDFLGQVSAEASGLLGSEWGIAFVDNLKSMHEFDVPGLASDEEKYKALGAARQKQLGLYIVKTLLQDADSAVTEGKLIEYGKTESGESQYTYPFDKQKLQQEAKDAFTILNRLNDDDFNVVMKDIKRQDQYLLSIILQGYVNIQPDNTAGNQIGVDRLERIVKNIEDAGNVKNLI